MLHLHVLTIFPEILVSPLQESILKRAQEKCLVRVDLHDLRQYTTDLHRTTDDDPYGGGPGMIMKVEPIVNGLEKLRAEVPHLHTILTCPQGQVFTQQRARELACEPSSMKRCRSATMC
jgi:tRNA (guanine37-N1)-methyltransferase